MSDQDKDPGQNSDAEVEETGAARIEDAEHVVPHTAPAGGRKTEWASITGRFRRDGNSGSFFSWMRNTARLWGFLGFVLLILIGFRGVVLPFILALLLTYVLAPVLNALCRLRVGNRRPPRWLWVIVLYLAIFGLNALFFTSFVPRVSADLKRVIGEAPTFWKKARKEYVPRAAGWLQSNFGTYQQSAVPKVPPQAEEPPNRLRLKRLADGSLELDVKDLQLDLVKQEDTRWTIRAASRQPDASQPANFETRINRYVAEFVQSSERSLNQVLRLGQAAIVGLLSAVTTFILTLMISAFLLVDTERILGGLRGLVDRRFHQDFDNVIRLIDRGLSGAIRGQLLICVVNGILTWIGLMVFGIKYSFLLALLAGVMSLIPIFGSILSSFPIVLVALTSGSQGIAIHLGLLMLLWIIGIHLIEANLLNPKIIGTAAKIHPVIVIFSVVAGERTYGPLGALLAVPLVSAVQAVFLYVRGKVRAGDTASDKPTK